MFSNVLSATLRGVGSCLVQVEVDIAQGMPCMEMIGYLSGEAREAKERVRVALKNMGISLPPSRITINLSPADIRKSGTAFDLAVAVGMLASLGRISGESFRDIFFAGELGMDGRIKPVRGILPMVRMAAQAGIGTCIVPLSNAGEGAAVKGTVVLGADSLTQVEEFLNGKENILTPAGIDMESILRHGDCPEEDFADMNGQETLKRAMEIAAAGFHHLLMIGPPGSGKTMAAKRFPTILPPLSEEECLEVSAVYSVAGRLEGDRLVSRRPFVSPHHTVSCHALVGGGRIPAPGAVSLAHCGVLFLDELTEFKRNVLDSMRQPLEDKKARIIRTYASYEFPADFMLLAAMNPCPCGHYPDASRCVCTEAEIRRYLGRISGPVLDRIDLCAEAPRVELSDLTRNTKNETSGTIRERVMGARQMQEKRFCGESLRFNGQMGPKEVQYYCPLGDRERKRLEQAFQAFRLSVRGYHKIIKVARTIADLEGAGTINEYHISEAVYYHRAGERYWNGKS